MKRRDVLRAIGAVPFISGGLSASEGQREQRGWKTAFGLNGFASSSKKYGKTFPLWEILDFAAEKGFNGIELHASWPMGGYPSSQQTERIGALKRLYDAYGLQVFSIQTSAGMDIHALKQRVGDRITLWGGIMHEHLNAGTVDDIRDDARRAFQHAAPGGGYILGSSHSLAVGAKIENVLEMKRCRDEWGTYPIGL